jgi:short-subunit dehydrogenase
VCYIGSISGILTTPFTGAYCASKSAVHSLSDALRMELAPFNIKVMTVQPGGIISDIGKTASAGISDTDNYYSAYSEISDAIKERTLASQINATPVEDFAKDVVNGILDKNPRPVIRLGRKR